MSSSGPNPRFNSSLLYDSKKGDVLLYGGEGAANDQYGDTWSWNGNEWVHRRNSNYSNFGNMAIYLGSEDGIFLFGRLGDLANYNSTMVFTDDGWKVSTTNLPFNDESDLVTYDSKNNRLIMVKAVSPDKPCETWILSLNK